MVTSMTEQPGPRDPAERRATDRPGKGVDVFGELQRWFIRQSAKNMRKEISGQVRRTLGGGRETSDVWDTATNEIPPEVGESPECQWCPICRAARRMRDSGPGIGGQLSGAGDVVASAVQDAISALDSLLSKGGGTAQTRDNQSRDGTAEDRPPRDSGPRDSGPRESGPRESAPRQGPPAGSSSTAENSSTGGGSQAVGAFADPAAAAWPGDDSPDSASAPEQYETSSQPERDRTAPDSRRDRHGLVGLPGGADSAATNSAANNSAANNSAANNSAANNSAANNSAANNSAANNSAATDTAANGGARAGGFSPAGEPADRLTTAQGSEQDPWGAATDPVDADQDAGPDAVSDGSGHGPDDRG
jgi:hypothetical protein